MVAWRSFEGSAADWDAAIAPLEGRTVFQSAAWAEHKSRFGWTPVRLTGGRAAIQVLLKRAGPGVAVAWARGGPFGDPADWDPSMIAALSEAVAAPAFYLRVCSYRKADPDGERALHDCGLRRTARPLDRDTTMTIDLTPEETALEAGLSTNWRHNLKRGRKRCASVSRWERLDPGTMTELYRSMEAFKGVPEQHDRDSLASLTNALQKDLVVFRADDTEGNPLAFRAAALAGETASDLLAAASPAGRKTYAAYALLWEQILECRRRGARILDLGGVDPEGAKGVYDFKRGTGATLTRFLGEWDWARPAFARGLASRAIALRGLS
jgi:hypothetical protein